MENIQKIIKEKLLDFGVSDIGFCKTSEEMGGFNNAVSIAVRLSEGIMAEVEDAPTHTYFNHYRTVNFFIDQALLQIGLILQKHGYRYLTVAASQSINIEGWNFKGRFSHKAVARQAGLGSIGNSSLFLHKDFGPYVRLGTVFTNCEFTDFLPLAKNPCTNCNICKDVCPSGAISGKSWYEGCKRENIFNAQKCSDHMKKAYKHIGRGAVCGLCISHCPIKAKV